MTLTGTGGGTLGMGFAIIFGYICAGAWLEALCFYVTPVTANLPLSCFFYSTLALVGGWAVGLGEGTFV